MVRRNSEFGAQYCLLTYNDGRAQTLPWSLSDSCFPTLLKLLPTYYVYNFTRTYTTSQLFSSHCFYSWCYCYADHRSVGRHQEHSLVHTSRLATHGLRLHPVHSHAFGRTRSAPHLQHPPLLSLTSAQQTTRVLSSSFCMLSWEENMRYSSCYRIWWIFQS